MFKQLKWKFNDKGDFSYAKSPLDKIFVAAKTCAGYYGVWIVEQEDINDWDFQFFDNPPDIKLVKLAQAKNKSQKIFEKQAKSLLKKYEKCLYREKRYVGYDSPDCFNGGLK